MPGFILPTGGGGGGGVSIGSATPATVSGAAGAAGAAAAASAEDHVHRFAFGSDAQGDIPVYNGTNYARLALGTSGFVLASNGTTLAYTQPLSTVGGATPSGGAIAFAAGGTTGIAISAAGNSVNFRLGVTSQAAGDLIKATSSTAWARLALGSADALLGVNGAGTDLAYTNTPWLTALHVGAGGSTGASTFGTGTVQAVGDTANGQAVGIRSDATLNKGLLSFFDDTNTQRADLECDDGNSRVTLRARAFGFRVTTDAGDTKVPILCVASNENVGLAGATAFGGMVDGVSIGTGTTAPSSVTGSVFYLFNNGGIGRYYCNGGHSLFVSSTERLRVFSAEVAVASTNFSIGQVSGSYGGGSIVVFVKTASADPSTNPTGGHIYYGKSGSGEPLWRVPTGDVRAAFTIGAAVASGLFVAASSGGAVTRELKKRPIVGSDGTSFDLISAEP